MTVACEKNSDGTVNVQYPGGTGGTLHSIPIEEAVAVLEEIKEKYINDLDNGIAKLKALKTAK